MTGTDESTAATYKSHGPFWKVQVLNVMDGVFSTKNPKDLYTKLCSDLARLKANDRDEYAAIDFFVTAESLSDWQYPGRANSANRDILKRDSVLLQVVSHIASGAKHFQVEAKHHTSVSSSSKTGGHFGSSHVASSHFKSSHFPKGNLVIELDGKAREELGEFISAVSLAERVKDYWERNLEISE